ncbi:eukaryotic integral membrane protein-domain-containing protein [Russula brevipes]|nr:eukaryotic integral membrane protein-domain-containing protein [Russula brevipes]
MAVFSPIQLIASIPPVTRFFTAATASLSLFYLYLQWKNEAPYPIPYLTLVPGSSLFYPWTFFTSVFVETTIYELIFTLIRLWGAVETIKFILVTVTFSNIIAFGLNWIEYAVLRNASLFLYGMEYHGQMALQIGALVAFTQIIPEHQVQLFGIFRARVKTLPMAYVTLSTVMCILAFQCPFILVQFGWLVSWIWLRFYKKNTSDTLSGGPTYGDRSETFALVNSFPPFLHTPISFLANTIYKYASRFHLIPSAGADLEANHSQPGSARAEAERRRAMALKALDQRLANPANTTAAQPSRPQPPASSSNPETTKVPDENEGGDLGTAGR